MTEYHSNQQINHEDLCHLALYVCTDRRERLRLRARERIKHLPNYFHSDILAVELCCERGHSICKERYKMIKMLE